MLLVEESPWQCSAALVSVGVLAVAEGQDLTQLALEASQCCQLWISVPTLRYSTKPVSSACNSD